MDDVAFIRRALERWIELVDARDVDGLQAYVDEFYAPDAWVDFGWRYPEQVRGEGVAVIVDWARDAFREWGQNAADFRYELLEVIEAPGGVIAPARSVGRLQGYEFETRFTYLFTLRDGKIASMTVFASPEEALAAASGDAPGQS